MTEPVSSPRASAWRLPIIGAVAVGAVAVGVVAGAFLIADRAGGVAAAAGYVPADAPMYFELQLDPSQDQDAALRDLLGRFPAIEGIDLQAPLYDQVTAKIDEAIAESGETDLTWAEDVAPWFDGRVSMAVTDIPLEQADGAEPPMPEMVVVLGVTDAEAARAAAGRLEAKAADDGVTFTETEHAGTTIRTSSDEGGAYAITDDAIIVAPTAAEIEAALDTHGGEASLADSEHMADVVAQLPDDWLAFGIYDVGGLMAESLESAEAEGGMSIAPLRAMLEDQPMRGGMAVTADGDRLALTGASEAPAGQFAAENEERGLADEVPGDALFYADGGNIGPAMAAFIGAVKETAAASPEAAEQIAQVESALGADLEEVVSWIDDGAMVVGTDGDQPYGGAVLVPNDVDAAERRIGQLVTFARLAAMDPSAGISISEADVAGTEVTTITWQGASMETDPMVPAPSSVSVEVAVTEDRALIGIGTGFVARVLELDPSTALSTNDRFSAAVDDLGGASNVGVTWFDVDAARAAVETAMEPMIETLDPDGMYEGHVLPWLEPLDRIVGVTRLEDGMLVQRSVLLVD